MADFRKSLNMFAKKLLILQIQQIILLQLIPMKQINQKTFAFQYKNIMFTHCWTLMKVVLLFLLLNLVCNQLQDDLEELTNQNQQQQPLNHLKNRVGMGQPEMRSPSMIQYIVKNQQKGFNKDQCILINAASFLLPHSLQSSKKLMKQGLHKIVIIANRFDTSAQFFINNAFNSSSYSIQSRNVIPDSQYLFLNNALLQCTKVIYIQAHFQIINPQIITDKLKNMNQYECYFSRNLKLDEQQIELADLTMTSIAQITPQQMSLYIFLFDPIFLKVVTPLNFAFYNKYNIEEMVIYPILALIQNSANLKPIHEIFYSASSNFVQNSQFQLAQSLLNSQLHNFQCFISLPTNPQEYSLKDSSSILDKLIQMKLKPSKQIGLVMFAPYSFKFNQNTNGSLFEIGLKLLLNSQLSFIRLRIRADTIKSSLSVYESVYTYCPDPSIIIVSRQNILFFSSFAYELSRQITKKQLYYVSFFKNAQGSTVEFSSLRLKIYSFRREARYYDKYFTHVQIFQSELFQNLYFWIFKNKELDFYQNQASFVIPLIETNNCKVKIIKSPLFSVQPRAKTAAEKQELQNLKKYYAWPKASSLFAYQFNALNNQAFRRNAKNKIPKKIHQIWLGNGQISPLREKLSKTLQQKNIDFQYKLWNEKDITIQKFPLTYATMIKIMEAQKSQERSLAAGIADLFRLQILLRQGGIYLDFKTQGLKPLEPFLKYEIFFIDMDYTKKGYNYPLFIGNTFIGSTPNNYYIKLMITQILLDEDIDPLSSRLPRLTGAYKLRKAFTAYELFTIPGFGFQLFSQNPNSDSPLKCSTPKKISADQEVFEIKSLLNNRNLKIRIPCKEYDQSYLVMYKELGRTWKKDKLT